MQVPGAASRRLRELRRALPLAGLYFGSTASLLVGTGAQLVAFVVLARHLGVEQFGQLMTITAATNLGAQLCGIGANEGLVRRVARDVAEYPLLLGHTIILMLLSGAVLTVAVTLGLATLTIVSDSARANIVSLLIFVVSNVVLFRWVLVVEQVFIARSRVVSANLVTVGFALARMTAAIVACVGFGVARIETWAVWHGAVHLVAAICGALAIARFGPPRWRILREEIPFGIHFSTPWLFWSLRQNVDLLILSLVAPPALVGSFGVTKRILDASLLPITSLNRLLYPRLAVAGSKGARATLMMTLRFLTAIVAIAASTSLALYLAAPWMPDLFGRAFEDMVGFLRILCWILVVVAVQNAAYEALGGADRHGIRALVYNSGSAAATLLIAVLTYALLAPGTFVAIYVSEILIATLLWGTLLWLGRDGGAAPAAPAAVRSTT